MTRRQDDLTSWAIDSAPVALVVLAEGGRIDRANAAAADLLDCAAAEIGSGDGTVPLRPAPGIEWLHALLERQTARTLSEELGLVDAGGQRHTFRVGGVVERDATGKIARGVLTFDDVTAERRREAELTALAGRDGLTGVLNRRGFGEELRHHLARAQRYGGLGTLLLVDLDELKRINDTKGHPAGDAALRAVADTLRSELREGDAIGRWGGDEFVLLLCAADLHDGENVARRLLARAREITPSAVPVSIGVAAAGPETDETGLLILADAAMYRAKQLGGDQVCIADPGEPVAAQAVRAGGHPLDPQRVGAADAVRSRLRSDDEVPPLS